MKAVILKGIGGSSPSLSAKGFMTKYRRISLTLVVPEEEEKQVRKNLIEALDIINIDNSIYEDHITSKAAPKPKVN